MKKIIFLIMLLSFIYADFEGTYIGESASDFEETEKENRKGVIDTIVIITEMKIVIKKINKKEYLITMIPNITDMLMYDIDISEKKKEVIEKMKKEIMKDDLLTESMIFKRTKKYGLEWSNDSKLNKIKIIFSPDFKTIVFYDKAYTSFNELIRANYYVLTKQ